MAGQHGRSHGYLNMGSRPYEGRFAPSPTGPLHFGSLVAAVASYADALAQQGSWTVRIEDIDPARQVAGSAESIIASLRAHGFEFPEPTYQSQRVQRYAAARDELVAANQAYRCTCSRKQLLATAARGRAGLIYPGTCAARHTQGVSVRLRCPADELGFEDGFQGPQRCAMATEIGDFLLWRGDNFVTYQLAVAIDDAELGCTDIVRGTDLLDSTFMQIAVQQALGLASPRYAHFPVITGIDGQKLSKQAKAPKIDDTNSENNLLRALSHLNQEPPEALKTAPLRDIWSWSKENWDRSKLARIRSIPERSMII